jgi:hypothetical protein
MLDSLNLRLGCWGRKCTWDAERLFLSAGGDRGGGGGLEGPRRRGIMRRRVNKLAGEWASGRGWERIFLGSEGLRGLGSVVIMGLLYEHCSMLARTRWL